MWDTGYRSSFGRWSRRSVIAAVACAVGVLVPGTTAFAQVEDGRDTYDLPISGGKVTISQSCFSGTVTASVHNSRNLSNVKIEIGSTSIDETLAVVQGRASRTVATSIGNQFSALYRLTEQRTFNNDAGSVVIANGKTNCPELDSLPASMYQPLEPTRVLDTRPNFPPNYSGPAPTAGTTINLPGSTLPKLPADAIAVAVQVTAVQSLGPGFVQVFPTGTTPGSTSNVNLTRSKQTVANAAVVKLGKERGISLYTSSGADLIVDVTGYFRKVSNSTAPRAGRLVSFDGVRALDTRPATSVNFDGAKPNGNVLTVDLSKTGKIPAGQAAAAVINVTSADSVGRGFVQVAPTGKLVPEKSSILNPDGTGAVAALTIVPVDSTGKFDIYTNRPSHLVVDVVGYFTSSSSKNPATRSGLFVPTNPSRVLDTRADADHIGSFTELQGPYQFIGIAPRTLGLIGVPAASRVGGAAWYNLTAITPQGRGFLQLGGKDLKPEATSTLNYGPNGQTVANAAIAPLYSVEPKTGDKFVDRGTRMYTVAGVNVAVDAAGYFIK